MSAFMCPPAVFDLIADYASRKRVTLYIDGLEENEPATSEMYATFGNDYANFTMQAPKVAKVLRDQNARSVEYRYGEDCDMGTKEAYRYRPCTIGIDPRLVLMQISCLAYQSCETPDWGRTLAHFILEAVKRSAIRELTDGQPWVVSEEDVRPPLVLA